MFPLREDTEANAGSIGLRYYVLWTGIRSRFTIHDQISNTVGLSVLEGMTSLSSSMKKCNAKISRARRTVAFVRHHLFSAVILIHTGTFPVQ
jgi:hypothetical protein